MNARKQGDRILPAEAGVSDPGGPGENQMSMFNVLNDPMVDVLAPGAGNVSGDDFEIPEDVRALFDAHGLNGKSYRCLLKEIPEGLEESAVSQGAFIKSWSRCFPSIDWIALNYGPGRYQLLFQFRGKDENMVSKNLSESVILHISDKFLDAHEDHLLKKKLKRHESNRRKVQDAKLSKTLEVTLGEDEGKKEGDNDSMMDQMKKISEFARAMGFERQSGTDWSKLLPMVVPIIPALMTYFSQKGEQEQARQREFMTLLLSTVSASNNNLLDMVKTQNGAGSGNLMIKEFKDMFMGAIDMKKALSEVGETSVADRIFGMIEAFAPAIVTLATMPKNKREQVPAYGMAQTFMQMNPDLQMLKDPAVLAQVITKWDSHFGWEQADMILEVANLKRPEACPRDPAKRYSAGDPRNNVTQEVYNEQPTDLERTA